MALCEMVLCEMSTGNCKIYCKRKVRKQIKSLLSKSVPESLKICKLVANYKATLVSNRNGFVFVSHGRREVSSLFAYALDCSQSPIFPFIIQWARYLFSDWPKAYSEFSKSASVMSWDSYHESGIHFISWSSMLAFAYFHNSEDQGD